MVHGLQLKYDDQLALAMSLQQKLRLSEQQAKLQAASVSPTAASASALSSSKSSTSVISNHSTTSNHTSGPSSGVRTNPAIANLPDEDPGKELYASAATRFCLLYSPWVSTADFVRSLDSLDEHTRQAYALNQDQRRFHNQENRDLGFTA